MHTKKTKIVATIGPATHEERDMERIIKHGVNVIRLNFSHGSFEEHGARVKSARAISERLGMSVGVLQDLSGPKIRIGDFYQERVNLTPGEEFVLTTDECVGDEHKAHISYAKLPQEVKAGNIIFLDDGKKKLEVKKVDDKNIYCQIIIGGDTKGRRGVNVPGAYLSLSSLTDKDKADLEFGLQQEVDFMAISFVRKPSDVIELREILKSRNAEHIKIISKIETEEAIENLDDIIAVSDGIMVARGDLAIEIPAEQVPFIQKTIIQKCNRAGVPVITATQMLESMISSPTPTRAEVNDVANAIFDGTDAVMLSEETTLGKYPAEAVDVMFRVAIQAEKHLDHDKFLSNVCVTCRDTTSSIGRSAINISHSIGATAIVALSSSGFTARMISRYKPQKPLVVFTPNKKTYNQLSLSFGCIPILDDHFDTLEIVLNQSREILLEKKMAKLGDKLVIIAGFPLNQPGSTNMIFVEKV